MSPTYPPVVTYRRPSETLSEAGSFSRPGSLVTLTGQPWPTTSWPLATLSLWTKPSGVVAYR